MIAIKRAKQIIASLGLFAALALGVVTMAVATIVVVSAGTGADPEEAFTEVLPIPAEVSDLVSWEAEPPNLLRSVEPQTRLELGAAWIRALLAVDFAVIDKDERALETWFAGGALEQMRTATRSPSATPGPNWDHHDLQVWFYSLDGQIAGVRGTSTGTIEVGDSVVVVEDPFVAVMILRDGNWRIENVQRMPTNR